LIISTNKKRKVPFCKGFAVYKLLLYVGSNMTNPRVVNIIEGEEEVAAAKPMTLQDRVLQIDHIQARRLSKLAGDSLEIASEGIIRHLRACARMDVNPDASAVREIIDDAINGRRVFAETSNDLLAA
jgi:hypothetical protein